MTVIQDFAHKAISVGLVVSEFPPVRDRTPSEVLPHLYVNKQQFYKQPFAIVFVRFGGFDDYFREHQLLLNGHR